MSPDRTDALVVVGGLARRAAGAGAVPGRCRVPGLFFAAGHFRSGILLAPVTAPAVADSISGSAARDLSPFSIERFSEVLQMA